MEHPGLFPEIGFHPPHQLRSQGDFRQQVQHLFSLPDRLVDQPGVQFRLARTGYPVQQHRFPLGKTLADRIQSPGLVLAQGPGFLSLLSLALQTVRFPFFDYDNALFGQSLYRRSLSLAEFDQVLFRHQKTTLGSLIQQRHQHQALPLAALRRFKCLPESLRGFLAAVRETHHAFFLRGVSLGVFPKYP